MLKNLIWFVRWGGGCAAAHNLRYRNLRFCALPFDWTYFTNDEAIYILANNFKNGFKNYMLKENLKELPQNLSHKDKIQYEDTFAKLIWANHFSMPINSENDSYDVIKAKFDRRFKRLINLIQDSNRICFLFSTNYPVRFDSINYLYNELTNLYPSKFFKIKVLSFNSEKNEIITNENIELCRYTRDLNYYDYTKTNYEWAFLDDIKLSKLSKKIRNKIKFEAFGYRFKLEWRRK